MTEQQRKRKHGYVDTSVEDYSLLKESPAAAGDATGADRILAGAEDNVVLAGAGVNVTALGSGSSTASESANPATPVTAASDAADATAISGVSDVDAVHSDVDDDTGITTDIGDARTVEVSHRWLDAGTEISNGRMQHESAELTVNGKKFTVKKGDHVLLWNDLSGSGDTGGGAKALSAAKSSAKESGIGIRSGSRSNSDSSTESDAETDSGDNGKHLSLSETDWVARIESLWSESTNVLSGENESSSVSKFCARWFYKKCEVERLEDDYFYGPITRRRLLDSLTERDLVLSNEVDENNLESIRSPIRLFSYRPEEEMPPLPKGCFVCRYGVSLGEEEPKKLVVMPYDGENDDWINGENEKSYDNMHANDTTGTISSDDSVSSAGYHNPSLAEGATTSGDIRVGPDYQLDVPAYNPKQKIRSRNPTMVWKQNTINTKDLDDYLKKASKILTPYAEHNNLTMEEPFTALPADEMEKLLKSQLETAKEMEMERDGKSVVKGPVFVSSISTASVLSSNGKNSLIRECNVDLLLENLHEKDYDVNAALEAIESSPEDFLEAWNKTEKESFDAGYRRYSGSLRLIGKAVGPSKTFKAVVDYHYRVKIPDQFRKYQDKKRDQAVRIIECIEARRFNETVVNGHADPNKYPSAEQRGAKLKEPTSWPDTSPKDFIGAVEEKRLSAKKLLLDIERAMGRDKMSEVASAIMVLHQEQKNEKTVDFQQMLKDSPDLLQRLNRFLPDGLSNKAR